jgi:hypothetical protein
VVPNTSRPSVPSAAGVFPNTLGASVPSHTEAQI